MINHNEKNIIMDKASAKRVLSRMAYEIIEKIKVQKI